MYIPTRGDLAIRDSRHTSKPQVRCTLLGECFLAPLEFLGEKADVELSREFGSAEEAKVGFQAYRNQSTCMIRPPIQKLAKGGAPVNA